MMIRELDFLSSEEIAKTYKLVHELKEEWIHRSSELSNLDDLPYYTLGVASYLDNFPGKTRDYFKQAEYFNKLLKDNFGFIYERFAELLSKEFSKKVVYHEGFALPGFQIFLSDWFFEMPLAPKHCDLHYGLLDWQGADFDPANNISFTAPISVPLNGAAVLLWEKYYDTSLDLSFDEHRQKMFAVDLAEEDAVYQEYQLGKLYLHSGNQYHQIAAMKDVQNEDERITFQGHAVLIGDSYHCFW